MYMTVAASLYRLLGDEVRLRILRLLRTDPLNVSELTAILGIAQSGVSRHLGLLRDAGLLREEPSGGFTYFRLVPAQPGGSLAPLRELLEAQWDAAASTALVRGDEARLQEIRRLRKENFDRHGAQDGQLEPGRSWAAWARALGQLLPALTVADLGCGEGYLTIEAARWASRVVAVDRSSDVLRRARALAKRRRVSNITWKKGEIERLPIEDAAVDVALLSQALHHASDPSRAMRESARILRPGGRVLLLDLRSHDQAWVRDRLGDRWLGFSDRDLKALLQRAGLREVHVLVGARKAGDPFTVVVASGRKPGRVPGIEVR